MSACLITFDAEAIVAAAEAGVHVLCEKPLCLTMEEAAVIRRAVAAAGITFMRSHNQLFLPPVMAARKVLREGVLAGSTRRGRPTASSTTSTRARWAGERTVR